MINEGVKINETHQTICSIGNYIHEYDISDEYKSNKSGYG
jgi:hypothetical protein